MTSVSCKFRARMCSNRRKVTSVSCRNVQKQEKGDCRWFLCIGDDGIFILYVSFQLIDPVKHINPTE